MLRAPAPRSVPAHGPADGHTEGRAEGHVDGHAEGHVDGPGLDRLITLTDAVVAIAMTLLVLPLVDAAGDVDTHHLGTFLRTHDDLLLSFCISFLVVYVFWSAHGGALRRLEAGAGDGTRGLRALNMLWLLVIAFLPFPTAVVGRELDTTSAPLYIGTMFVLSALTSAIVVVTNRSTTEPRTTAWAWVTTAVFAVCTALSLLNADLGMFALLSLVAVRILEMRLRSGRR